MSKPGYTDQGFWFRLIFMVLYWIVLNISLTIFGFLVLLLSVIKLGSKHEANTLSDWLKSVTNFIHQIFQFLSFATDDKPFPFQPWPQDVEDGKE